MDPAAIVDLTDAELRARGGLKWTYPRLTSCPRGWPRRTSRPQPW